VQGKGNWVFKGKGKGKSVNLLGWHNEIWARLQTNSNRTTEPGRAGAGFKSDSAGGAPLGEMFGPRRLS